MSRWLGGNHPCLLGLDEPAVLSQGSMLDHGNNGYEVVLGSDPFGSRLHVVRLLCCMRNHESHALHVSMEKPHGEQAAHCEYAVVCWRTLVVPRPAIELCGGDPPELSACWRHEPESSHA